MFLNYFVAIILWQSLRFLIVGGERSILNPTGRVNML
jgi:hypothetical protein